MGELGAIGVGSLNLAGWRSDTPPVEPSVSANETRAAAALVRASGRISLLVEADGTIAWVSPTVQTLLGYEPDALVGTPLFDLYDAEHREYSRRGFQESRRAADLLPVELGRVPRTARVRNAAGALVPVESFPTPLITDPAVQAVLIEWRPVSDRRFLIEAIDGLALGQSHHQILVAITELVQSAFIGMEAGVLRLQDGAWAPVVLPGARCFDGLEALLPPLDDPGWRTNWLRLIDDAPAQAWAGPDRGIALVPLRSSDDGLMGAVVMVHERIDAASLVVATTENVLHIALRMATLALADERSRSGLREAAERDSLTGLLNRAGLSRRSSELAEAGVGVVGLVYIDLDDFKPVNDAHGHGIGDAVLIEVGRRIRDAVRDDDVVCRVGGDEFAVLCAGSTDRAALAEIADRARRAISRRILVESAVVGIGASIGLAFGSPSELTALLGRADGALYQAKRSGKSRVIIAA